MRSQKDVTWTCGDLPKWVLQMARVVQKTWSSARRRSAPVSIRTGVVQVAVREDGAPKEREAPSRIVHALRSRGVDQSLARMAHKA